MPQIDIKNFDSWWLFISISDIVRTNGEDIEKCIENIDIGGVSLMRASAKNFKDVTILSNPSQYDNFMNNNYDNKTLALESF